MGSHPINLAVRFFLEMAGLIALGLFGWHYGKGVYKYVLVLGIPIIAAILWGTFAVIDDPSRSGDAIIQVTGILRLLLELAFFTAAAWSLFFIGAINLGWIYSVLVVAHYLVSYDRVLWLIQQ
jgi:hypothetical protein